MIAIQKLLLDYQDQPLLGAEEMPQLGWVLQSDERNVRQSAYQWQLADTESFEQPLYDSGRVDSDESRCVPLPDVSLLPCRKYFIRAKVWTETEETDPVRQALDEGRFAAFRAQYSEQLARKI